MVKKATSHLNKTNKEKIFKVEDLDSASISSWMCDKVMVVKKAKKIKKGNRRSKMSKKMVFEEK